jgi:hypothetical protein
VPPTHWESSAQVVWQLPVPHRYGEQSRAVSGEQIPLPLHVLAGWKVVAVGHEEVAQTVPAATWAQAPLTQKPVLPQVPFGPQRPCGSDSGWTVPTGAQVPCPLTLHAWQTPQPEVVQQTPSTQLLVAHSCAALHVAPGAFLAAQEPFGPVQ